MAGMNLILNLTLMSLSTTLTLIAIPFTLPLSRPWPNPNPNPNLSITLTRIAIPFTLLFVVQAMARMKRELEDAENLRESFEARMLQVSLVGAHPFAVIMGDSSAIVSSLLRDCGGGGVATGTGSTCQSRGRIGR